ncbi:unnamed protein product [Brassica napus]|uniref:(rape) hypothetical protein n=1 Tax=Brassica napus TaxID=3708 RepID=A0A816SZS4_BRANA|nr:unnamed protein product [Brassica napus]
MALRPNRFSQRHRFLWESSSLLRVGNRAAGTCVASSPDSDLERSVIIQHHGSGSATGFSTSR